MTKAGFGIAGVNTRPLFQASLGIAGLDRVAKASVAIAGNMSSTLREVARQNLLTKRTPLSKKRLGDVAAARTWERALWFPDFTYLVCTNRDGGIQWRNEREAMFGAEARAAFAEEVGAPVRLFLDSSAYRRFTKEAPPWATYENYLRAIDLVRPDAYMAYDVFGDSEASLRGYERMVAEGYGARCIPVWPITASWDNRASDTLHRSMAGATERVRAAIANARRAVQDPVFRYMAARSPLIAIGAMVQGPCPREVRHIYFAELCRLLPDHQFWGMGQASHVVINGLKQYGLLDRVWLDGSWWILHAMTDQIAVIQNGLIKSIDLRGSGTYTTFKAAELMACNLRSATAAYLDLYSSPGPPEVPTEVHDMDAMQDLKRRITEDLQQSDLWTFLGKDFDKKKTGTEG